MRQSSGRSAILVKKNRKTTSHSHNGKHWDQIFSEPRPCDDHPVYQDWSDVDQTNDTESEPLRGQNRGIPERELISKLLESFEVPNASWESKVLAKFLSRPDNEVLVAQDDNAWAWIDDRGTCTGRSRDYEGCFNSKGLYETLEQLRFGHPTLQDVDQRMIYIPKLTPSFVSALAKTGWHHQMKALRDAIWKHIAFETSMRVQMPILGFRTYQLEFHMEHLLLRPSSQNEGSVTDDSIADLSFLELADGNGQIVPHSLYRGHMTLVICGWSNMQWTGYVFTQADNDGLDNKDIDKLKGHFLTSEYGFDFATPPQSVQTWDARRYWLRLVAHRSQYVLQEWLYLIRTVEEGVEAWKSQDPCNSGTTQGVVLADDIKRSLDKTLQTMQLLRRLRDTLSATLRAYNRFSKSGGDMCYFSDIRDCSSVQNSIVESFEKLTDLLNRLHSLDDSCKRFATHLGRMLDLENNRLIIKNEQLSQESNMYHLASHQLSERMHKLNEETCVLNKEIHKLNERSTEAACANQAEAIKTSRSTRVNVELLLLTTPLGMVLQYFSSEQEILFFKRNPKTFVLATLVLMLLLRLLALALQHGGTLLRLLYRKPSVTPKRSQPPGQNSNTIELEQTQNV